MHTWVQLKNFPYKDKTNPSVNLILQHVLFPDLMQGNQKTPTSNQGLLQEGPPSNEEVVYQPWEGQELFVSLILALVMSVFGLELPGILVCSLHIVDANITQDFLQVNLGEGKRNKY